MGIQQRRQIEREIDLIEVIWNLLEQWKAVFIVALIMALLVPCAKYYKDNKDYLAREEATVTEMQSELSKEQIVEDALRSLTGEEREAVEYILEQREWMAKEKSYIKDSVIAQTDPTNQRVLRLIYDINCENNGDLQVLSKIYSTYTYNYNVINTIKPFIAPKAEDNSIMDLFYTQEEQSRADEEGRTVIINLVLLETSDEKAIEKAITAAFINYSTTLRRDYPHTIKLADSEIMHIYHKENVELMIRSFSDIDRIEKNIKDKTNTLSDTQKAVIERIQAAENEENPGEEVPEGMTELETQMQPMWSKKYTLLGFIIGVMLYSLAYICMMILRGRINCSADAENYIGARLLGEIRYETEGKGLSNLLRSRTVGKLRNQRVVNADSQIEKIKESLDTACKHAGIESITLFDLIPNKEEKVNSIIDDLTKCKTEVEVLEIAEEIDEKHLLDIKDAVLVVGKETSIAKLEALLGLCDDYDINIRSEIFIERR